MWVRYDTRLVHNHDQHQPPLSHYQQVPPQYSEAHQPIILFQLHQLPHLLLCGEQVQKGCLQVHLKSV